MTLAVNLDEYVSETIAFYREIGETPTLHEVAVDVTEAICNTTDEIQTVAEFNAACKEVEAQLDYYLQPGEVR
jgi:hypothetical protein